MKVDLAQFKQVMSAMSLVGVKSSYDSYRHCTLQCVVCDEDHGVCALKVTAMTPEATLVACVEFEGEFWAESVSVRTTDLYDAIRNIPASDGKVSLTMKDGKLRIRWGRGSFNLPSGHGVLDYVAPQKAPSDAYVKMAAVNLKQLLERVSYWDTDEDDKAFTEVVRIERYQKDEVHVVHCSPKLVSLVRTVVPEVAHLKPFNMSLLTARMIKKLADLLPGEVSFRMSDRDLQLHFASSGSASVDLYAMGVELPYPAYMSVIPRGGHRFVDVRRDDLYEALRRAASFDRAQVVLNTIGEEFGIRIMTESGVSSEETIVQLRCTWQPADMLKFNADTLLQSIAQFKKGGTLRLKLFDSSKPIVLTEEDNTNYLQVLSHMRF